jgi:hypothetical protein
VADPTIDPYLQSLLDAHGITYDQYLASQPTGGDASSATTMVSGGGTPQQIAAQAALLNNPNYHANMGGGAIGNPNANGSMTGYGSPAQTASTAPVQPVAKATVPAQPVYQDSIGPYPSTNTVDSPSPIVSNTPVYQLPTTVQQPATTTKGPLTISQPASAPNAAVQISQPGTNGVTGPLSTVANVNNNPGWDWHNETISQYLSRVAGARAS